MTDRPAPDYEALLAKVIDRYASAKIPLAAQLELTKRCSLNCVHCYVDHAAAGTELTTEEWIAVLDELAAFGVLQVVFTGGEPFLRSDIWTLLEAAAERQFYIRLLTSGTRFKPGDIARLQDLPLAELHLSLYSHIPERHDAVTTVPGSFEKTRHSLIEARAAGLSVWVKAIVMRGNRTDIPEVARLAREQGCHLTLDANLTPAENDARDPLAYRLTETEMVDFFADPQNARLFVEADTLAEACAALANPATSGQICNVGRATAVIDAYGNVQPCALYPPLDSIRNRSFSEIWQNNPDIERLRSLIYEEQTQCPGCPHVAVCSPCPALAQIENGDARSCSSGARLQAIAFENLKAKLEKPE